MVSLEGFSFSDHGPLQWQPGRICISVDADRGDFAVKMIRLHQEQQRRAKLQALFKIPWHPLIIGIDPVVLTERETEGQVEP